MSVPDGRLQYFSYQKIKKISMGSPTKRREMIEGVNALKI